MDRARAQKTRVSDDTLDSIRVATPCSAVGVIRGFGGDLDKMDTQIPGLDIRIPKDSNRERLDVYMCTCVHVWDACACANDLISIRVRARVRVYMLYKMNGLDEFAQRASWIR